MEHINHRRHEHHLRKRVPVPQEDSEGGTKTVVQVVYVTADPTFAGQPAGMSTIAPVVITVTAPAPETTAPLRQQNVETEVEVEEEEVEEEEVVEETSSSLSPSTTFRKTTKISSSISHRETSTPKFSSSITSRTAYTSATAALEGSYTSSSTPSFSTPTNAPVKAPGLGVGVYAGIIGGGVAVCLILVAVMAILIRKKQRARNYTKPEDEKNNRLSFNDRSPASPVPMPTPATAPKLSIRPMTQFDAAFMAPTQNNNDQSKKTEDQPAVRRPVPTLALNENKKLGTGPFQTPEPSPAMSAFSDNSNLSLPIQGGTAPTPVHRIMVDFKPSMADELELVSGELVRLLHEYDDGWALCIRMDRSQQGVCPRTCLSQRPVKPRSPPGARGPPPPNGMRNAPPRPQSPGNRQPMSPKGMPGPPRGPKGPDSRPSSPAMNGRQPHPLSKVQRDDDVQFHAM